MNMNTVLLEELRKYKVKNIEIVNDTNAILNNYVAKIYVINMIQDVRKRNYIHLLFKKYNINYNLILVDKVEEETYETLFQHAKLSKPELGCTMSHMWCLIHILKNEYKNAIIFEDDVIFSKTFVEDFIHTIETVPAVDFLLLGAHDFNFSRTNYKHVQQHLYRPEFDQNFPLYGAHANYYSFNGAKRMFYIRATNLSFFDNEYHLLFDTLPNSYVCHPNLVIANMNESGISSTHKKDFFTQYEHTYYNCCFKEFDFKKYNMVYTNIFDAYDAQNLQNLQNLSAHECIHACLAKIIDDPDKIQSIQKRINLDFLDMDDILYLLTNQHLITPNNLSKK